VVSISDTGKGIPDSIKVKVFVSRYMALRAVRLSEHQRMRGWNILLSQVKYSLP
jgi:signal transduction histidine kinase